MASVAVNYFITINELTAHNTASAHEEVVQLSPSPLVRTLTPLLPYTPFVLFALLFVIAFGILVVNRAKSLKNITIALFLALISASIPTVLTYIGQGSRQEVKAGPEEVPRNIRVAPVNSTSVRISWETDAARVGVVRIGKTPYTSQTARVYIADNQESVRVHSVEIDKLVQKASYEFEIMSGTTWYDNGGKYIQFTVP